MTSPASNTSKRLFSGEAIAGVLSAFAAGLRDGARLSVRMLLTKFAGKKSIVLHCAPTQFIHLESLVSALMAHPASDRIRVYFVTREPAVLKRYIEFIAPRAGVYSQRAIRFLVGCDLLLSVEQGCLFPWWSCPIRACSFHGQPSKANVYERFNYRQINTLFFYGPLMRDYYIEHARRNPHWPEIQWYEVGQPLTDKLFESRLEKGEARRRLGLDPERFTVVYAPSFEYCSSLSVSGASIIDSLLSLDINVVVKPHPAFYNTSVFQDEFNQEIPNATMWRERIEAWGASERCVFRSENTLDSVVAFSAADVMLTDYSGVGFDGILLDLGMIYWDCPEFYGEYLPNRYGIDGEDARRDLACNAGLETGIEVRTVEELASAIAVYRECPEHNAEKRERVRVQLLFNPGAAAQAMAQKILEIMGVN